MDNASQASLVPLFGIKILVQNCDSLNLSTFKNDGSIKTFNRKIEAILTSNADIVLLCDIRSKNQDKIIEHYIQCTATGGFKIPSAVGSVSSSSRYSPDVSAGPPLR